MLIYSHSDLGKDILYQGVMVSARSVMLGPTLSVFLYSLR